MSGAATILASPAGPLLPEVTLMSGQAERAASEHGGAEPTPLRRPEVARAAARPLHPQRRGRAFRYVGTELEVAAYAKKWKSYVASELRPYLVGDVLEVGAGMGAATESFYNGTQRRWVCLEPDPRLAERIASRRFPNPQRCEVAVGALRDLSRGESFDAILYMDVLEHIRDDVAEMSLAITHLRPGGVIAVVAPAFPRLYSQFDAAVGHYRRYTMESLRAVAPPRTREEICRYLDSAGMLMSVGNRFVLQSPSLTAPRVLFWDRMLVPVSRIVDPLLGYRVGRSLLMAWRKLG